MFLYLVLLYGNRLEQVTATGRENTIVGNACSEPLNQPLAFVLRQERIQPVIVKTDVEVVAHVGFEEGGGVAVEI